MRQTPSGLPRLRTLRQAVLLGLVTAIGLTLAGDRAFMQVTSTAGIDPLEAFDSLVKNNVLIALDTSFAMRAPVDAESLPVGDDDIESRFYQAKKALTDAVSGNSDRLSFGLVTFGPDASIVNGSGATGASNESANPTGAYDGPFVYVSFDTAASAFYGTAPSFCSGTSHTLSRFFCGPGDAFASYDANSSGDVYLSLSNSSGSSASSDNRFADPYPRGCTGSDCRYYIQSRLLRNDVLITANDEASVTSAADALASTPVTASACGTPPSGVFAETDSDRPCFKLTDGTNTATFWYVSTAFATGSSSTCDPLDIEQAVPDCSASSGSAAVSSITTGLGVAVPVDDITGYSLGAGAASTANDAGGDLLTKRGVRTMSGTGRPLKAFFEAVHSGSVPFPTQQQDTLQKNFLLLVTAGTDFDCANSDPDDATDEAVDKAQELYESGADDTSNAELLVVAFSADAATIARLNRIARAGSGDTRDAFVARTKDEIDERIREALEVAAGTGEFSTAPNTVATVFEFGGSADTPSTRYDERSNVIYQTTVEMPGWQGHLYAFLNDSSGSLVSDSINTSGQFDAGEKLYETTVKPMLDSGGAKERFTFADLHAGATVRGVRSSSAALKRRVLTSSPSAGSGGSVYNRTFARSTDAQYDASLSSGSNVVALWPPNQTGLTNGVADLNPAMGTSGPLDGALGLATFSVDQLQGLGACRGSAESGSGTLPGECATDETDMTRKEAREILLAWAGGAQVVKSAEDGLPLRDGTSGELLFEARDWLLGDTTLAQPAVVTPPLGGSPKNYGKEWVLFRDGRRDSSLEGIPEISKGFGLRDPDGDDGDPESDPINKPVMSVVYSAHNDGLHAFRAGQNCDGAITDACAEEGGEELWTFVPVDQLHKLYYLALGQSQSAHVYVTSASVRVSDIFIPGSFTIEGQSYGGRWRTVLYFGRGPGGKFLTALDVTGPGPYTEEALDTNPPWVLWNVGNEDSRVPGATSADTGFDTMGETWSVPAIGRSEILGSEYVAWVGSGFGDSTTEGSTFYALSAQSGSILFSNTVGQGTATYAASNALVASPSAYNQFYLKPLTELTNVVDRVTRVYIPDVQGRIWRFDSTSGRLVADLGARHPMADGLALMEIDVPSADELWLFGGTGNDTRVPYDSANPFEIFGFRDTSTSSTPVTYTSLALDQSIATAASNTGGFRRSLRDGSSLLYRSAAQPAAALNEQGNGRVFFIGRRYSGIASDCDSSFGSILFGLGATSGGAAYDFSGDGSVDLSSVLADTRATGITTQGGAVFVSSSGGSSPTPPVPGMGSLSPSTAEAAKVNVTNVKANTTVCRGS